MLHGGNICGHSVHLDMFHGGNMCGQIFQDFGVQLVFDHKNPAFQLFFLDGVALYHAIP